MKALLFSAIISSAVLMLTGCGTTAEFNRPGVGSTQPALSSHPLPYRVEVVPFQDMRDLRNQSDNVWFCLIPLWPYGRIEYASPENAEGFVSIDWYKFVPTIDLGKATADALEKTNLFRDIEFVRTPLATRSDFILRGIVYNTDFQGRVSLYGLSWFGIVLWPCGFPIGQVDNRLTIQLQLFRRGETSPRWEYISDKQTSLTIGLYYNFGGDVDGFAELMADTLKEAFEDLVATLDAKPSLLN